MLAAMALRQQAATALACRLQSAVALSSATAVGARHKGHPERQDETDDFIFQEHCKGKRVASKEAQELSESLRRNDFGSLKARQRASLPRSGSGASARTAPNTRTQSAATRPGRAFASGSQKNTDNAAQELTEKGSKRMMASDDGREELSRGSFDLDRTTERVMEEGKKDASQEAQARADDSEVKEAVKSRIVSGSQTG